MCLGREYVIAMGVGSVVRGDQLGLTPARVLCSACSG